MFWKSGRLYFRWAQLRVVLVGVFEQLRDVAVGLEPPLEHPLGLALLRGDEADDLFAEALRDRVGVRLGDEPVLVAAFLFLDVGDQVVFGVRRHSRAS